MLVKEFKSETLAVPFVFMLIVDRFSRVRQTDSR